MPRPISATMSTLKQQHIYDFDLKTYNFVGLMQDIFGTENLEDLHTMKQGTDSLPLLSFKWDQKTWVHRHYYESEKLPALLELYEGFVRDVIAPQFDGEPVLVYQKKPTFRCHLPNNVAVPHDVTAEPDKPGLHCDNDYNHPEAEVNYWLPVTRTLPENTMWTESEPMLGDYAPVIMQPGQVFRFWGAKCRHYNMVNRSDKTRVSIDFRVVPFSQWREPVNAATVQTGTRLVIGAYYDILDTRMPAASAP